VSRRRVGSHQRVVADRQPCVHHLVAPVGRHVVFHGRFAMRLHHDDRAAEGLLIQFERLGAAAVEVEVRGQLHDLLHFF
jgi:hypothetical protein